MRDALCAILYHLYNFKNLKNTSGVNIHIFLSPDRFSGRSSVTLVKMNFKPQNIKKYFLKKKKKKKKKRRSRVSVALDKYQT